MTLNDFMQAAGERLESLWPDREVKVDKIPRDADGCFFLGLLESSQSRKLGRRYLRPMSFQVLYFLKSEDILSYQEWAEAMYDGFRLLEVPDGVATRTVRPKNCSARQDSNQRYYQFLFDLDLIFLEVPEPGTPMDTLIQKEMIP